MLAREWGRLPEGCEEIFAPRRTQASVREQVIAEALAWIAGEGGAATSFLEPLDGERLGIPPGPEAPFAKEHRVVRSVRVGDAEDVEHLARG